MNVSVNRDGQIEITEAYVGVVFRSGDLTMGVCQRDDGWELTVLQDGETESAVITVGRPT